MIMKKLTLLTALIIATTSFAQVPNYVPTNGLVGWWPFNGNANDESGNGNNGTVNGATLTSDRNGVANTAYSFDGIDDFLNGSISNLTSTYSSTISTWIKYEGNSGGQPYDLFFQLGQYGQHTLAYGYNYSSQQLDLYSNCFTNPYYSANIQNDWHHLIILDSLDKTKLYIDGQLIHSFISGNSNECFQGSSDFLIGGGADNQFTTGIMDEIAFWNRALTDCEIKDLYNSQLGSINTTSSLTQTALDTYTWPVNNQTYTQSGTYSDTLVNAAGCDSIVTLNLTLNYTGINENNSSSLVISPNPTTGSFSLHGLEQLGTITSLRINDNNGKIVQVLDPKATQFAFSSLKTGVYFLEVISSTSIEIIKLIKE
jgi:hypothetical protein